MSGIEIFHYYRQDIMNSRYDLRWLTRFKRGKVSVKVKNLMANVRKIIKKVNGNKRL